MSCFHDIRASLASRLGGMAAKSTRDALALKGPRSAEAAVLLMARSLLE